VGIDVAKELTFTGRVFDGAEAQRLGGGTRAPQPPSRSESHPASG